MVGRLFEVTGVGVREYVFGRIRDRWGVKVIECGLIVVVKLCYLVRIE